MHESSASELVSICIPTYGHANYIEACVRSVLEQTVDARLEVLVGDDASPDGTREILRALAAQDPRLHLVLHDRNVGGTANLSGLVKLAQGNYIAHLDGDDVWYPGKLAAQLAVMRDDESVVACYCNARVVSTDGRELGLFNRGLPARIGLNALLLGGNRLCHSSLLYRAAAKRVVIDIEASYIDYRLHLRFLRHGTLAHLEAPLVGYRWRTPASVTGSLAPAVIDGHLDAFSEALSLGAEASVVRAAAAPFWGKVLVKAALGRDMRTLRQAASKLLTLRDIQITRSWLFLHSVLAIPRAMRSLWSRNSRSSVYFP